MPPQLQSVPHPGGYLVEAGMLRAWLVGLENKLFVSNEKAARDFGVFEIINKFTIREIETRLSLADEGGAGRVFFETEEACNG